MRNSMFIILALIGLGMTFTFQNCAKVKFNNLDEKIAALDTNDNVADDDITDNIDDDDIDNDDVPDDVDDTVPDISENPSCDISVQATVDLHGESFKANGNLASVSVANGDEVSVNGNIGNLRVDGANEVKANGNIKNVCIRAHYIERLNGNLGGDSHITIIGQSIEEERAHAQKINGNSRSNIVLADVDVDSINGNFKEIHAYNSQISHINGNGGKIHLYDGASVLQINGNIGEIVNH